MKVVKYILVGFIFGIVLTKSEVISVVPHLKMSSLSHVWNNYDSCNWVVGIQIIKRKTSRYRWPTNRYRR
jgi:hypothetical protein